MLLPLLTPRWVVGSAFHRFCLPNGPLRIEKYYSPRQFLLALRYLYRRRGPPNRPVLQAAAQRRSFYVDEKSAIQALDRLGPVLPLSPGRAERHGFDALALCNPLISRAAKDLDRKIIAISARTIAKPIRFNGLIRTPRSSLILAPGCLST
jgi:hypothetical protein